MIGKLLIILKKHYKKELVKIKDSVLSQVTKTMISEDVKNLSPDEYYKIQSAFSELAQYVIKFITPSYPKVKEIERKLNFLVEEYKIKLNPEYYLELGKVYYNISKYQDALEIFCKVLNETSPNTDRLYIKGITFYYLNRYNEALEVFNQALINNSDDADVWYIKGIILFYLHRHQEAIEALNKATILSPYNADVWHSKGSNLVLLNRCQEALKAFDQAIKLNPDNADFWNIKGLTNLVLGNHEEALSSYKKELNINPNNAESWYNRALIYTDKDNKELGLKELSIAIELDNSYKQKAKKDNNFKKLWEDEDFKNIVS